MPTAEKIEQIEKSEKSKITPFPTRLEYHPTIHDMPSEERPRERLRSHGARALSHAELLAIILRTGTSQDNVIELAHKLLAKYGGLAGLMRADFAELCAEHGLGDAKTAQVKAALEIGRRLGVAQPDEKYQVKSPADAAALVMMEMTFLDHEQMRILVLDTKNQVVENIPRYQGTVNSSVLRAAEVYRPAILRNCPGVLICHNHPSGDPTPSPKERPQVTRYFIGISPEKGFYINPALLVAHAHHTAA